MVLFLFYILPKVLNTTSAGTTILGESLMCLRNTSFSKEKLISNGETHPLPAAVPGNRAVGRCHHHRLLLLLPGGQELQDYGIV